MKEKCLVVLSGGQDSTTSLDWICVSPKAGAKLAQIQGDELKLVFPQIESEAQPENFAELDFRHRFIQPLDDENRGHNTRAAIDYCLEHPAWKLSLQTHKFIGIP